MLRIRHAISPYGLRPIIMDFNVYTDGTYGLAEPHGHPVAVAPVNPMSRHLVIRDIKLKTDVTISI